MIYENVVRLAVNREVKIVVHGQNSECGKQVTVELDFFIRDGLHDRFRPLIGKDHPQYWKFKRYSSEKSQYLQLEYSGVSRSQLNESIEAFKQLLGPDSTFVFKSDLDKRIRHLKGIRVSAMSIRKLSDTL
jgi:hypothetical protein